MAHELAEIKAAIEEAKKKHTCELCAEVAKMAAEKTDENMAKGQGFLDARRNALNEILDAGRYESA